MAGADFIFFQWSLMLCVNDEASRCASTFFLISLYVCRHLRTCQQKTCNATSKSRNCTSRKSHATILKRSLLAQFKLLSSISATQECFIENTKKYHDLHPLVRLCAHGVGSLLYTILNHNASFYGSLGCD